MSDSALSDAETLAEEATKLPAFAINLLEIRRNVRLILSQFGKEGIFSEYTPHDMSHIDDMLNTAAWIIPENTKKNMTPADWLTLVLAIYFHDMGLVVTKQEFENRKNTNFPDFCKDVLFSDTDGADYYAKISALDDIAREKFLYQEFVRHNHPARVRTWIEGKDSTLLGYCKSQVEIISQLLASLSSEFRNALGIVCESHGLDDLDNTKKYPQNEPFGNSKKEEVNIQYVSALLRTIDLIQITSRRAPSALYRMIDPVDPISQQEWAKQNKVRSVRAQLALDDEGVAAPSRQSDTIEVFATFDSESSFFGLNSYIRYAREQLKETYSILNRDKYNSSRVYDFPWRNIDDNNIKVDGFEQEPFGFEIDQEKILDLLTGHTLYNNSDVVIRELTQNSIDAVRLKCHEDRKFIGKVFIHWDSNESKLTIKDNGTGMSQSIIENHLLKVGSSRYQSQKFKDKYPEFNPISRFGIGVLTAFMVADKVEITTISPEETYARSISLRSVHGKYLIKLLQKGLDNSYGTLGPHGSKFVLTFRASARKIDIENSLRNYVMFPGCQVDLQIDDQDVIRIGFNSPKDALEEYLKSERAIQGVIRRERIEVSEIEKEGITVAYAMGYSNHYRDWQFVRFPERRARANNRTDVSPIATCIEGIVIHKGLLGEFDPDLLAVVNLTGQEAPKTNVARSILEITPELNQATTIINRIMLDAVQAERVRLVDEENYSLTWAVEQMPLLIQPIVSGRSRSNYPDLQNLKIQELGKTKIYLAEENGNRRDISCEELRNSKKFWTIDSVLLNSSEQLIREAKREVPRSALLNLVYGETAYSPDDLVVTNIKSQGIGKELIYSNFEIDTLKGNVNEKRLDARWVVSKDIWIDFSDTYKSLINLEGYDLHEYYQELLENLSPRNRRFLVGDILIPIQPNLVAVSGLDEYQAVRTTGNTFILPTTPISNHLASLNSNWRNSAEDIRVLYYIFIMLFDSLDYNEFSLDSTLEETEKKIPQRLLSETKDTFTKSRDLLREMASLKCYDPLSWRQRNLKEEGF